jgi:hypothetical protein
MNKALVLTTTLLMLFCFCLSCKSEDTILASDHVVVILDNSGSMSERMTDGQTIKMDAAKQALTKVLSLLPKKAHVGILVLNGDWGGNNWIVPVGSINMDQIQQRIASVTAGGGTPLGARLKDGADALLEIRDKTHYGSYRLLVVTDGIATDGNLMEINFQDILKRGIIVDVIGVMMEGEHPLAKRAHSYRSADDPASLEKAIKEVLAETSVAGADSSQEDFELAAALPEEMTASIIKALCASANQPIGEVKPAVVNEDGTVVVDKDGKVVLATSHESGISTGWIIFWIVLGAVVVGLVIFITISRSNN